MLLPSFFKISWKHAEYTLFPYTTLFRSIRTRPEAQGRCRPPRSSDATAPTWRSVSCTPGRSEEHTSELQSRVELVCRLLLEKKKQKSARASHNNSLK